jgi:hypothetical protein
MPSKIDDSRKAEASHNRRSGAGPEPGANASASANRRPSGARRRDDPADVAGHRRFALGVLLANRNVRLDQRIMVSLGPALIQSESRPNFSIQRGWPRKRGADRWLRPLEVAVAVHRVLVPKLPRGTARHAARRPIQLADRANPVDPLPSACPAPSSCPWRRPPLTLTCGPILEQLRANSPQTALPGRAVGQDGELRSLPLRAAAERSSCGRRREEQDGPSCMASQSRSRFQTRSCDLGGTSRS